MTHTAKMALRFCEIFSGNASTIEETAINTTHEQNREGSNADELRK